MMGLLVLSLTSCGGAKKPKDLIIGKWEEERAKPDGITIELTPDGKWIEHAKFSALLADLLETNEYSPSMRAWMDDMKRHSGDKEEHFEAASYRFTSDDVMEVTFVDGKVYKAKVVVTADKLTMTSTAGKTDNEKKPMKYKRLQ
jgi:hypothetical protein